jgi:hypothetical protein
MGSDGAGQLVEVSMGMGDFSSEWMHCDRISSYVARLVCQNRADPLFSANLFSSALNELLEVAFLNHGSDGDFTCLVRRIGDVDMIEIGLPSDEKALAFYTDVVNSLARADIEDLYHAALFAPGPGDARLGLFELAVDYKAKIGVSAKAGRITISAEIATGEVH